MAVRWNKRASREPYRTTEGRTIQLRISPDKVAHFQTLISTLDHSHCSCFFDSGCEDTIPTARSQISRLDCSKTTAGPRASTHSITHPRYDPSRVFSLVAGCHQIYRRWGIDPVMTLSEIIVVTELHYVRLAWRTCQRFISSAIATSHSESQ